MIARIEGLAIPPAWRDVRISPRSTARLQATGLDAAGRRQYLYHPEFRAAQEAAKYDRLISFAERLPELRAAMAEHMECEPLCQEWVSAVAVRVMSLGWLRVGSERYARESRTYGVTTLRKRHVQVRGRHVRISFVGKGQARVRTVLVDPELAGAVRRLVGLRGGSRLFRYVREREMANLTSARLNDYIQAYMGDEFSAKDFRTWGGTLLAAIALAEHGIAEDEQEAKRTVVAVVRRVAERLGNTPSVCRASYISPAVIDHYLRGRTIETFRNRHLRVVGARTKGLEIEEEALLRLLRSWRIGRSPLAA